MAALLVVVLTGLLMMARPGVAAANAEPVRQDGGFEDVSPGFTVYAGEEFTATLATILFPTLSLNPPDVVVMWGDGTISGPGAGSRCTPIELVLIISRCELFATHVYQERRTYAVGVRVYSSDRSTFVESLLPIQVIERPGPVADPLDQFVLVSVGDSVASGEGSPTQTAHELGGPFPFDFSVWDDGLGPNSSLFVPEQVRSLCHRSQWAHGWQLLRRLKAENPETRFTMVHRACTGAGTKEVAGQIEDIDQELTLGQQVDALLISVGANDRVDFENSFGDSVTRCLSSDCVNSSLGSELNWKFENLQPRYDQVAGAINQLRSDPQFPRGIAQTYITEYYDPTKDEFGHFDGGGIGCTGGLITPDEWNFLYNFQVVPLNHDIREAALRNGWTFVDGIANRFVNHGFCAPPSTRFVMTHLDSLNDQHDVKGTAHPSRTGQWVIADEIYHAMLRNQPPRSTAEISYDVAGGPPYMLNTWTNHEVVVRLRGKNLRGAGAEQLSWKLRRAGAGIVDEGIVQARETEARATRPHSAKDSLRPPFDLLGPGQSLWSEDGRFRLTFQFDGNLVLYQGDEALWASNTVGVANGGRAVLQADGNFVIYDQTLQNARWASNTAGNTGAYLIVQNDGNVVIYSSGDPPKALWATGTFRRWTTLSHDLTLSVDGEYQVEFGSANAQEMWEEPVFVDTIQIDRTPPATRATISPSPNDNGWHRTDVTVTLMGEDSLPGIGFKEISYTLSGAGAPGGDVTHVAGAAQGASVSVTIAHEGVTTLTYFSTDHLGNREDGRTIIIRIDRTPPAIQLDTQQPAANEHGWNRTDITATWSCSDGLSGPIAPTAIRALSTEGANQSLEGICEDRAGNTASHTVIGLNLDKTPPGIALASRLPAANAAGWNRQDITATWSCDDDLSGPAAESVSQTIATEGRDQSLTGSCTDVAGNEVSHTIAELSLDKTPPTTRLASRLPAANAAGWNRTDITATWSCADGLSGPIAPTAIQTLSAEGANQSVEGTCLDAAGNSARDTVGGLNLDKTAPAIAFLNREPIANEHGWANRDISATWSCSDALSGPTADSVSRTIATEGRDQSLTAACSDVAGNEASHTVAGLSIDKTPPGVTFGAQSPAPNAAGWNNTPVSFPFTASDDLSGIASTSIPSPLWLTAEGDAVTGTVGATDAAGNSVSVVSPTARIDLTPPLVVCSATPSQLWPPNHRLVEVSFVVTVDDAGSGPAGGFTLASVTSNEPDNGHGDGDFPNDVQQFETGTADTTGLLRAERSGQGTGRHYTTRYLGTDKAGNDGVCIARVTVPHDQRR